MGKLFAAAALAFLVLVGYITLYGKPNTTPVQADPQKVIGAAGDAGHVVGDVADPWWQWFFAQPWAYAAIGAGVAAWLTRRWWLGMNGTARVITAVVGTVIFLLVAIGLAR